MPTRPRFELVLKDKDLFAKFRKIFDKQPDREAQVEALVEMSDDFG